MHSFENKNFLVVGGASGLGLEIARGFATRGASLALSGRSLEKLKAAGQLFNAQGLKSPLLVPMNVCSYASVDRGVSKLFKKWDSLDGVICTAGIHLKVPAVEMTSRQWKTVLDTNLNGTFHVNSVCGKKMIRQGHGNIINIASLGSRVALSLTCAYNVSKSGVEMLTKSLASEWAPFGVRVNAILPGVFKTALNEKALSDSVRAGNIINHTPMKRFGKLPEIVSAAMFLASEDSSFVTGTSVIVDGGFLAYAGF